MKKFKLIKEYPASPKLGFVVFERHCGMYHNIETGNMYGSQMIENQPEFWEEVVEKDYEILISRVVPQEILSVKRLSDGEVFTVGDLITGQSYADARVIEKIKIRYDGSIELEQKHGDTKLVYATKAKQPLFITHDKKDIFAGDKVWWVNKKTFEFDYFVPTPSVTFFSDLNTYFLTREEAEDYIIENKPALSIKEFWQITSMSLSNAAKSIVLRELVKKRLNLK